MKTVIISGYFDPLHVGHIEYIRMARELAGTDGSLIVIVNNRDQALLKKGYEFMPCGERAKIIGEINGVDYVIYSRDVDESVTITLKMIVEVIRNYDKKRKIIFANGGDRHNKEIPEAKVCKLLKVKIVDGLGKKIQSSSELVRKSKLIKKA
jgi:cytidyltransferase-like protein